MGKKFGFSFSWKRAIGISAAKGKLSKQLGIPLTRSGRQRKVGRAFGCCVQLVFLLLGSIGILALAISAIAHGGGLDSLGCHHDRQRGGYHCHRGPLAGKSFASKAEAEKALEQLRQTEQKQETKDQSK
jgi:hypothetical protein